MLELTRTARLDVLVEGYARLPHVAGTVSLVRDADRIVIVDPGMVADRELILRPLRELGVRPDDVTDVVDPEAVPRHRGQLAKHRQRDLGGVYRPDRQAYRRMDAADLGFGEAILA